MQTLELLGWNDFFQDQLHTMDDPMRVPARVVVEYQDRYRLHGEGGPFWAHLSGTLRLDAELDKLSRPAVGDWVLVRMSQGHDPGTITDLLARRTSFVRQAAGRRANAQVVAANVDTVFVVTSCNRDFNPRRIERYLATIAASRARPVIVLNKADLCHDLTPYDQALQKIAPGIAVAAVSALEKRGLHALHAHVRPGETVALVGSSGVGKSTLVNWLLGTHVQEVREVRDHDERGRHTTTHRELFIMPAGGVLIDTPGMRELKLWSTDSGLDEAFADIDELARRCRFRDCAHRAEPGCAIHHALASGEIDPARVQGYLKLAGEQRSRQEQTTSVEDAERRRQGRRGAKLLRQHKRLRDH